MGILRKNCVRAVCLQLILCFVFMLFACSTKAPEHPITVHLTIRCEDLENDAQAPDRSVHIGHSSRSAFRRSR